MQKGGVRDGRRFAAVATMCACLVSSGMKAEEDEIKMIYEYRRMMNADEEGADD